MSGFNIGTIPHPDDLAEVPTALLGIIRTPKSTHKSVELEFDEDATFREDVHDLLMEQDQVYQDLWNGHSATGDDSTDAYRLVRVVWDNLRIDHKTKKLLPRITPGEYVKYLKEYYKHVGSPNTHDEKWYRREIEKLFGEKSPVVLADDGDGDFGEENGIPEVLSLAELKARPDLLTIPEAIIPNFVWSGNVTLVVGRDKGGKSTCVRSLISRYSHIGRVLWVRVEENTAHILQKFEDMGANLDNIFLFIKRNPSMEQIRMWVDEIQPEVIVVDTLSTWLSENGVTDENASSQIIPLITPFTDLAQETGAGLLLPCHKQKSGKEYRGSTAVGGNVDMILTMTPSGRNRMFKPVGRFEIPEFTMSYDGTHYHYVTDRTQDDWDEWIYKLIEENPRIGKNKLREAASGDHVRTDRSVGNLIDQGRVANHEDSKGYHHYCTVLDAEEIQHTSPAHLQDETVLEKKPSAAQHQHGTSTPKQHAQVPQCAGGSPLHGKGNQHSRPTPSAHLVESDLGFNFDAFKAQKLAEALSEDDQPGQNLELDFEGEGTRMIDVPTTGLSPSPDLIRKRAGPGRTDFILLTADGKSPIGVSAEDYTE